MIYNEPNLNRDLPELIKNKLGFQYCRHAIDEEYLSLFESVLKSTAKKTSTKNIGSPVVEIVKDLHPEAQLKYDKDYFKSYMLPSFNTDNFFATLASIIPSASSDKIRRMHLNDRALNVDELEAFICCSAFHYKIDLKRFLALYLFHCQYKKQIILSGTKGYFETVNKLLAEFDLSVATSIPSEQFETNGIEIKWSNQKCLITDAYATNFPPLYDNSESVKLSDVSSLLNWDSYFTTLRGREDEWQKLKEWLENPHQKSIQCIYGDGGVGKTRLAFDFARYCSKVGWTAGGLSCLQDEKYCTADEGILLIIDYPEEKRDRVVSLLIALRKPDFNNFKKKIRVLLLSRNINFSNELAQHSGGILTNAAIRLKGIDFRSDSWDLFVEVIEEAEMLDENKLGMSDANISNMLNNEVKEKFYFWLSQDQANKAPLIIIAFGIYLSSRQTIDTTLFDVKAPEIIRFITKREFEKIANEVVYFSKSPSGQMIDMRPVLLLKAICAISGGIDEKSYIKFYELYSENGLGYELPEARTLKRLSFFNSSGLKEIKPNLFAADFLDYTLEMFAGQEAYLWIFMYLGFTPDNMSNDALREIRPNLWSRTCSALSKFISKDVRYEQSKINPSSLTNRVSLLDQIQKLSRLMFDIQFVLKKGTTHKDLLSKNVKNFPEFCLWFSQRTVNQYVAQNLEELAVNACSNAVRMKLEPAEKGMIYGAMAMQLKSAHPKEAIVAGENSVACLKQACKYNFVENAENLARSQNILANKYSGIGNLEEAIAVSLKSIQTFAKMDKKDVKYDQVGYAMSLNTYANNLRYNRAPIASYFEVMKSVVLIYQDEFKKNPSRYRADLAKAQSNFASLLIKTEEVHKGYEIMTYALSTLESLTDENFSVYALFYGQLLTRYCYEFELKYQYLVKAIEIYKILKESRNMQWIEVFPDVLVKLLDVAEKSGDSECIELIEDTLKNINNKQ